MGQMSGIMRGAACLLISVLVFNVPVFAAGKPLLSEEIDAVIQAQGIKAAQQRFAEIYPEHQDEYDIDVQGMMNLGSGYMQNGDMDTGMAVMEMMTTVNMDMMSKAMNTYSPEMAEVEKQVREAEQAAAEQEVQNREQEQRLQQKTEAQARGKARDDLERFVGIYGDPGGRALFVAVSCDGFLVTGPMWADIAPWWMRSAADTVFTYADSFTQLSMEFETDGQGIAQMLKHDLEGIPSPLARSGPLPSEWESCVERPLR